MALSMMHVPSQLNLSLSLSGTSRDLAQFVAGFAALERISVHMRVLEDAPSVTSLKVPTGLRYVSMKMSSENTCNWLATQEIPSINHLEIHELVEYERDSFQSLLNRQAPTLKTVKFLCNYGGKLILFVFFDLS